MTARRLTFALAALFVINPSTFAAVPLGGFIPFVGFGLTDQFKDGDSLDATFFITDQETSMVGTPLTGNVSPFHDLALLDTGAATHILTPQASGIDGFNIDGNDFDGTNTQIIGGATGQQVLDINDPLAIFAAGLGDRVSAGSSLVMNTAAFRGQSSVATLSARTGWTLPNILGLPMAAQHSITIKNSEPHIFTLGGRTVRTPQVVFDDLGIGGGDIVCRAPLKLRPGTSFIAGPLYIQSLDFFGGEPFHENPLSPTIIENGGLFVDVDMANGSRSFQDKEFLFDTGADMTVVSEITAARLGFDPVLDTPDFILEVEGSGGVSAGIPGFYIDELNIDTVGGTFTLQNVPIAVLDVTNPNDPGNVIDGIIGMHLFTGRDLVIDANPSAGQGGTGPSLYISNPVTETHVWTSTLGQTQFQTPGNWSASGTPDVMWVAELRNTTVPQQFVVLTGDSTVNQLVVAGSASTNVELQLGGTQTITTFGEIRIEQGGTISLLGANTKLDAQFINMEGGILRGNGTVFVGTGPVNGAVRNLGGRVEPGNGIGRLNITGDFSNLDEGTLAIQLGGTTSVTQYDVLAMTRFAFLDGSLEVTLANGFVPSVGNMFTFITTAANGVFGEFENLQLPGGFQWDVDYLSNSVVLKVIGLGSAGDFDGDGDVDGRDLLIWQRNPSVGNLADWQANFGNGSLSAVSAVPEPASLFLMAFASVTLSWRRR
jgi:hypothetical protein